MITNVLVTAAELCALILLFVLIYGLVNIGFKTVATAALSNPNSRVSRYRRQTGLLLLFVCTLLCLVLVGINGYLLYQGKTVLEVQWGLLQTVSADIRRSIAISLAQCGLLALLVKIILPAIRKAIRKLSQVAQNYDRITANDESVRRFFDFLSRIISTGIWIWTAVICTHFLQVPAKIIGVFYWSLGTYLIIVFGILIVKAMPILVDTLDTLMLQFSDSDGLLRLLAKFRDLTPVLKRSLELIIYVGTASIIFQYTDSMAWLSPHAYTVIGLITVYFVVCFCINLANVMVEEFSQQTQGLTETQHQRRLTIAPLIKNCLKYTVYFGAIVAVLGLIHIDPTPILAGAGILGIAVGFGAQNLINDVVSGFFILFENYYLVGDYIAAGKLEERPIEGFVEAIELRTTQVRHPDGQLQIVRNGEIGSVVNYSKQYIYARVDIPLAYDTHLETAYAMVETVGRRLKLENPEIVIEFTQVEGLESFGKNLMLVRTLTKVKPGQHLYIQRLLRKMLKETFDQSDIELASLEPENHADGLSKFQ